MPLKNLIQEALTNLFEHLDTQAEVIPKDGGDSRFIFGDLADAAKDAHFGGSATRISRPVWHCMAADTSRIDAGDILKVDGQRFSVIDLGEEDHSTGTIEINLRWEETLP